MNTALLAAVFGTMIVAGLIALVLAVRPHTPVARPVRPRPRLLTAVAGMSPRSRMVLVASVAAGLLIIWRERQLGLERKRQRQAATPAG